MTSISRYKRKEYGPYQSGLPKALKFLGAIKFNEVIERQGQGASKIFVEVSAVELKRILASKYTAERLAENTKRRLDELEIENSLAIEKVRLFQLRITELENYCSNLSNNNKVLMDAIDTLPEEKRKTLINGYFSVMEAKGIKLTGLPRQGGLPSLGKKR